MLMATLGEVLTALAVVAATPEPARFSCGAGCTAQVEPWCADGLRVRMFAGAAPLEAAGALQKNKQCGTSPTTTVGTGEWQERAPSSATVISNGGVSASWADGFLRFSHSDTGTEFLTSDGPIAAAFSLSAWPTPPPAPPAPGPYACQDSCTLGATGIREQTDAKGCVAVGKFVNITRPQCCASCTNNTKCVAWAWGRDSADKDHRHTCYLCGELTGTERRLDRDFGCVERSSRVDKSGGSGSGGGGPAPLHRTNWTYFSTAATFASTPNETIVGLGQRSLVHDGQCSGGKSCGQWKLNQKGFSWPLGITKYQIAVPFYVSSRRYGFLWNAPGEGQVSVNPEQVRLYIITESQSRSQARIDKYDIDISHARLLIPITQWIDGS